MYVAEDGQEYITTTLLNKLPMPQGISKWYSYYYNTMYIYSMLAQGSTAYYLRDVTEFLYYFDLLMEETEAMGESETDTLTQDMYKVIQGDLRLNEVRNAYYNITGVQALSKNFQELWTSYLDLYELYRTGKLSDEDGKFVVGENGPMFEAMMANLIKLSPSELYGFLSSMNFLYANSREITLVLSKYEKDEAAGYLNTFSVLLNAYYSQVLSEDAYPVFQKLISAVEYYALVGHKDGALDKFKTAMSEFNTAFNALSTTEQNAFDGYFEGLRPKYDGLYQTTQLQGGIELDDDAQAIVDKMASAIEKIYDIQAYIQELASSGDEEAKLKDGTYIVLFALYEQANYYYNALVEASAEDADLLTALYSNPIVINEKQTTIEAALHEVGTLYWRYITGLRLTMSNTDGTKASYSTFDIYVSTNLNSYLSGAADLLYAQYSGDCSDLTVDYIITSLRAFHGIDRMGKMLLRLYDGVELSYGAISAFYQEALKNDAAMLALANKLVEAAQKYLEYSLASAEESDALKAEVIALVNEAIALKDDVTDTDAFNEYLAEFYNNYVDIQNNLQSPEPPEETPAE